MSEIKSLKFTPPRPRQIPHEIFAHGLQWNDPYFWLRDRGNPEVLKHLQAENAYTEQMMADTQPFQEKLYKEILSRIKETDLSVPVKIDDYFYYTRTEQGKQYAIHCRKKGGAGHEEIILDQNVLAEGLEYFRLGVCKVSPDHQKLAYSVDANGSELFTVRVKDLQSGRLLPDTIPATYPNLEWAADNRTFFYTILDPAKRPYQLLRHRLDEPSSQDALVYHEEDEAYFVTLYKTKDRQYLMLDLASKVTTEIRCLESSAPGGNFQVLQPRIRGMEYSAEHYQGKFLIVTNDAGAQNFKLIECPVTSPSKNFWKEIIGARPEVKIEGMSIFQNHWVLYEREQGLTHIRVMNPQNYESFRIDFPEPVYTVEPAGNPDYHSKLLRFEYASLITPPSVFDFDMETKTRELKKQQEVLGGYDSSQYVSERLWARSHDGVQVPVSIVYKRGISRNGQNPLFLYGYGSYGISIDPGFSSIRLSLLNRGFVYAIAHIRGGGDLGRPWYDDGKILKKKNTFYDFIAAAEHLIQQKYTSGQKLVIEGGSAGGLLMGAVTNMRPELFSVVIAKVPFVDVIHTMMDPSLPLTVTEYDEWGNPADKKIFDLMRSYSPYDNVAMRPYPWMLITGGLNDPRVQYWEPVKWAARLRDCNTGQNPMLLKMEMGAGHGGPSGRYEAIREIAFDYAFIFKALGIKD